MDPWTWALWGRRFTWNHGSSVDSSCSMRLDRALCDDSQRRLFNEASVKHLQYSHSDHCPLLVQLERETKPKLGERPFRFHTSWTLHRDFKGLLERERKWEGNWPQTLTSFYEKPQTWNMDTFGNKFKRKKRNQLRLEGVHRQLKKRVMETLLRLKGELKEERGIILSQEEMLQLQKSCNDWLRYGDGNKMFFHTSTLVYCQMSKVIGLKGERNYWRWFQIYILTSSLHTLNLEEISYWGGPPN